MPRNYHKKKRNREIEEKKRQIGYKKKINGVKIENKNLKGFNVKSNPITKNG